MNRSRKKEGNSIFVLISDGIKGDITLSIFIDYENFTKFAGPLIALREFTVLMN